MSGARRRLVSRLVLGASGVAAAALAFLPALVALLLGLLDIGAHAVLGLAGALLGVADAWLPGNDGWAALPPYRSVAVSPLAVLGWSALRAAGPVGMVLVASFPLPGRRARVAALAACALALAGAAGWPSVLVIGPGLVAALRL